MSKADHQSVTAVPRGRFCIQWAKSLPLPSLSCPWRKAYRQTIYQRSSGGDHTGGDIFRLRLQGMGEDHQAGCEIWFIMHHPQADGCTHGQETIPGLDGPADCSIRACIYRTCQHRRTGIQSAGFGGSAADRPGDGNTWVMEGNYFLSKPISCCMASS